MADCNYRTTANYAVAYSLSRIARLATNSVHSLVEGMWNPDHNAADGCHYALSVCEDLRRELDSLEKRARKAVKAKETANG